MPAPLCTTPDETLIRRLIEDWAQAVRKNDRAGIVAHHHPEIVMFDVPPPLISRGLAAYAQTWDFFFREADYQGIFELDELSITAGNDVAFASALMHCGTLDESSPNQQLAFRLTVGLRKIDGQWIIVHEHHSIPARG